MMQQFFALVLIPCMSAVSAPAGKAETVAYACPETAHFVFREEGEYLTPMEFANKMHITDGHRDDRAPPEIKKKSTLQKIIKAKKKRYKHKYKQKRRRA